VASSDRGSPCFFFFLSGGIVRVGSQSLLLGGNVVGRCFSSGDSSLDEKDADCPIDAVSLPVRRKCDGGVRNGAAGIGTGGYTPVSRLRDV
jgi:hypothetical protein